MQTNAVLRKQAIHLFWQNRGILWATFLIFALVNFLWYEIQTYQIRDILIKHILNIMYQLAIAPVMSLGLYHMLMRMINSDKANMSMLFHFVRSPIVFFKTLAVGLVTLIPNLMILLYYIVGAKPEMARDETTIFMMMTAAAIGLGFFMILRLFLLPYLYVKNPQESLLVLVNISFQTMKGQARHLLWFGITVYIWPFLLAIALLYMINPFVDWSLARIYNSSWLAFQLVMSLFMVLVAPYFSLAFTGYANELLSSERDMK